MRAGRHRDHWRSQWFHRKHPDEMGVAIHGSLALELLWSVIPLGIVMVMFAWSAKVFFDLWARRA